MTDVGTTPRRSMTPARKLRIFEAAKGKCHICDREIRAGEPWDAEHVIALALGGPDTDANLRPAHRACHVGKGDATAIAQAKRRKQAHLGIRTAPVQKIKSAGFPKSAKAAKRAPKPTVPNNSYLAQWAALNGGEA